MLPRPWIANAAYPDGFTLKRLLQHPRFAGKSGEEMAVALWHYTVDPKVGFYHFGSPADLDQHRPHVKLDYVKDPLKLIHSYGYMLCGTVATLFVSLCEAAGIPGRVVGITGHTVCEVFFDHKWHLFDCDMCGYYRLRDEGQAIAGLRDLLKDPSLVSDPVEKIEPYGLPDRSPQAIRKCYDPGKGSVFPNFKQEFHSMDYVLRPGESLIRYSKPVGERWSLPAYLVSDIQRKPQINAQGPRERFPPHRTYANGVFKYQPDLTSQSRDVDLGAWRLENLETTEEGLKRISTDEETGRAEFLIHSPWVITGRNEDLTDPTKTSDGALARLEAQIPDGNGRVVLEFSLDGEHWEALETLTSSGIMDVDFTPKLKQRYRALLAIKVEGHAVLSAFETEIWFQLSHNSYPYLSGNQSAFAYRGKGDAQSPTLTEIWEAGLNGSDEEFHREVVASDNLKRGSEVSERLLPVDADRPWQAVFKVAPRVLRPGPVRSVRMWAAISSCKGDPESPPPGFVESGKPLKLARIEAAESLDGPWKLVAEEPIPVTEYGWHFAFSGAYQTGSGADAVYMRITSDYPGYEARASITCGLPDRIDGKGAAEYALQITHRWEENGALKAHLEKISKPLEDHEYTVRTDSDEYQDTSVEITVPSVKR